MNHAGGVLYIQCVLLKHSSEIVNSTQVIQECVFGPLVLGFGVVGVLFFLSLGALL